MQLDWSDMLLMTVIAVYLFAAPYSKVEESFNIQAIHDILFYGFDLASVCSQFS